MPKIHGRKETQFGPRVDCHLYHMNTTPDVFWSERKNSYVLVEVSKDNSWLGKPECDRYYWKNSSSLTGYICLVSINGVGEVRWSVSKERLERELENSKQDWWKKEYEGQEYIDAARHFGLI